MRRHPLTKERIVATAIELADREGLAAVSLRQIANRLDVHVTSLYNHVATKEALLDAVVEKLMLDAKLPAKVSGWEDWVRQFGKGLRRAAHKHPGAIAALYYRPVQGTTAARFPELGLAVFRAAGCDINDAYSAVKATALVVLGLLLEEVAPAGGTVPETDINALPATRFPQANELRKLSPGIDIWKFTIEALISGLAAKLKL